MDVPKTTQGYATVEPEGFEVPETTNPNLYRQVKEDREIREGEVAPRDYQFIVQGVNSYRVETIYTHDEDSETCEIP